MKSVIWILSLVLLIGAVALVGCRGPGPAEEAGRELDEAMEDIREGLDPAGPAEQLGRDIDDAVENIQEEVDDLRDRLREDNS